MTTIEFIGVEGVGKQTVIAHLAATLQEQGLAVATVRLGARPRQLPTALLVPRLATHLALEHTRRSEGRRDLANVRTLALRSGALAWLCRRSGCVLVDEGPRHRTLALAADGMLLRPDRVLAALPRPDLVVSLRADLEQCVSRLRQKPPDHWSHDLGDEPLKARLARYLAHERALRAASSVPIIDSDNADHPPTTTASDLATLLNGPPARRDRPGRTAARAGRVEPPPHRQS